MNYWGLWVTFYDMERNQFLPLVETSRLTERGKNEALSTLPASSAASPFIVSVKDANGIVSHRWVTRETVEAFLGRTGNQLIEDARTKE